MRIGSDFSRDNLIVMSGWSLVWMCAILWWGVGCHIVFVWTLTRLMWYASYVSSPWLIEKGTFLYWFSPIYCDFYNDTLRFFDGLSCCGWTWCTRCEYGSLAAVFFSISLLLLLFFCTFTKFLLRININYFSQNTKRNWNIFILFDGNLIILLC